MATGVYMAPDGRHPAALVTVEAACGLLQDYEAPAFTIAAVQCLRGAKLLTAAEISKLMPTNGIQSSEEGEDTKSDNDSDAPAVVQRPEQAAWSHLQASHNILDLAGILAARVAAVRGGQEALAVPQVQLKGPCPVAHECHIAVHQRLKLHLPQQ